MFTGTTIAMSDSVNGIVKCMIGISTVDVRTPFKVFEGDTIQYIVGDNKKATISGVIGAGDKMHNSIMKNKEKITKIESNQEYIALMTGVDIWDDLPQNEDGISKAARVAKRNFVQGLWIVDRIKKLYENEIITKEEMLWILASE